MSLRVHLRVAAAFRKNVQRASLRQAVRSTFESAAREQSGELSLVIGDDSQLRVLNRTYRGVDAPTDVLAFVGSEAEEPVPHEDGTVYHGDVIISYPRAVEQAAVYGHPVEEELWLLVIHGVLHLLGYDHERAADKEEMWRVQGAALARLGVQWRP